LQTDTTERAPLEPIDPRLTSIQPGGGIIMRIELAWGVCRRYWLKTFRKRYVERMRACRRGDVNGCPHEVLDPRDLKYYRNQPNYWWDPRDDPFAWRDRLPFARDGLAELLLTSTFFFGAAALVLVLLLTVSMPPMAAGIGWVAFVALLLLGTEMVWFFRSPRRTIPKEPGLVVSPADGKVVTIEEIEHDEFIGGPAVLIGIFLSIFNVHVNRMPAAARVIGLTYQPGKFLNALRPESARENEQLAIRIEETAPPCRRMVMRQITGAIARRIVCRLKPGDELARGELFGMIKLGSRAELVIPKEEGLEILTRIGEHVHAGSSTLARYGTSDESA
jgi:phosphatidylserine decarboxylase